jgi:hypothetical protein
LIDVEDEEEDDMVTRQWANDCGDFVVRDFVGEVVPVVYALSDRSIAVVQLLNLIPSFVSE